MNTLNNPQPSLQELETDLELSIESMDRLLNSPVIFIPESSDCVLSIAQETEIAEDEIMLEERASYERQVRYEVNSLEEE